MKFVLVLAFLAMSVPLVHAQPTSVPALATIDPAARDLLARLNKRYKRFQSFQCVIELRTSEPVPWTYSRIRVRLTSGSGVVSTAIPGKGVEKRVYDGRTELRLDSRYPRVFQAHRLDAEPYSLRVFLKQAGVEGTTADLLSNDNLASLLLEPDLQSLSSGSNETSGGQTLRTITFQLKKGEHSGSLKLLIDPEKLLLLRVEGEDRSAPTAKTFSFSETYSQIQFDTPLAQSLFSTSDPKGFKRVSDFPDDIVQFTKPPLPEANPHTK